MKDDTPTWTKNAQEIKDLKEELRILNEGLTYLQDGLDLHIADKDMLKAMRIMHAINVAGAHDEAGWLKEFLYPNE